MIEFIVPGNCQAKQRPRYSKRSKTFYTPPETRGYELEVKWAAKLAMRGRQPFTEALKVEIVIRERIPRSWCQSFVKRALAGEIYPQKGDLDNKIKSLSDGMNGIIYVDDKQIVNISAKRIYDLEPSATVKISE